jgi:Ca-activated chloride channel family protein
MTGLPLSPITPGNKKVTIKKAIMSLGAGGSTAGAQGILTAYEIAQAHFMEGGNNRVILGTDGDFNVGISVCV